MCILYLGDLVFRCCLYHQDIPAINFLFRFGGERFPPIIMFKIFISSAASGVKYLSGKKMIRPASDVCTQPHPNSTTSVDNIY